MLRLNELNIRQLFFFFRQKMKKQKAHWEVRKPLVIGGEPSAEFVESHLTTGKKN